MKNMSKILLGLLFLEVFNSDIFAMKRNREEQGQESSKKKQELKNAQLELVDMPNEILWEIFFHAVLPIAPINTPEKIISTLKTLLRVSQVNKQFHKFLTIQEIAKFLKALNINIDAPNSQGYQAIHIAAENGHIKCIDLLLQLGANIHAPEIYTSGTPIHIASCSGHPGCIRILHKLGADLHTIDADGASPMHWAASEGKIECLETLCELGANPNFVIDDTRETPLHWAVGNTQGHPECIEHLVRLGTNINAINYENQTALHIAVDWEHPECVKELLRCGADIRIADTQGRTALNIAINAANTECAQILVNHYLRNGIEISKELQDQLVRIGIS